MATYIDPMDLFQVTNQFLNKAVSIQDTVMKEKARSDLLNMKANLDMESNNFMNDLAQRNDYTNWQQDIEDFIQKQSDTLFKNSRNNYTAKQAQEMLLGYRTNLMQRVDTMRIQAMQQDTLVQNANTRELNKQVFKDQALIDANSETLNAEYANGSRNSASYMTNILATGNEAYSQHYMDIGQSKIDEVLANGGDYADVVNAIMADDTTFKIQALDAQSANPDIVGTDKATYIDVSNNIDKNAVKQNSLKMLSTMYTTKLKAMQDRNENSLANLVVEMDKYETNGDFASAYATAKSGLNTLDKWEGNELDAKIKTQYAQLFKARMKYCEDGGKPGSKGAIDLKNYKFTYTPKLVIDLYKQGRIDSLGISREMYMEKVREEINLINGISDEDKQYLEIQQGTLFKTLERAAVEEIFNGMKDVQKRLKSYTKKFENNPGVLDAVSGFMMNYIGENNVRSLDEKEVCKVLDDAVNVAIGKDPRFNFGDGDYKPNRIGKVFDSLSQKKNDFSYTDNLTGKVVNLGEIEKVQRKTSNSVVALVAQKFDVPEDLKSNFQMKQVFTGDDCTPEFYVVYNCPYTKDDLAMAGTPEEKQKIERELQFKEKFANKKFVGRAVYDKKGNPKDAEVYSYNLDREGNEIKGTETLIGSFNEKQKARKETKQDFANQKKQIAEEKAQEEISKRMDLYYEDPEKFYGTYGIEMRNMDEEQIQNELYYQVTGKRKF